MNRKQRISVITGFIFLVMATLFPPWNFWGGKITYAFLFAPHESLGIALPILFVEWMLIAFLSGGLVFIFKNGKGEAAGASLISNRNAALVPLTVLLGILVIFSTATALLAVKKFRRIEMGIKQIDDTITDELPMLTRIGDLPSASGPSPNYAPPTPREERLGRELFQRIQQLRNAKAQLDKLQ